MTQLNQVPQEDQEDQTQAVLHFPSDQVNPESLEEPKQRDRIKYLKDCFQFLMNFTKKC